jgi:hypothetical protein
MHTGTFSRRRAPAMLAAFVAIALMAFGLRHAALARSMTASVQWNSIGPVETGGYSGKLNAFAYSAQNPKIMYVAGGWGNTPRESPSQAGIFRTTDGGAHWSAADGGLTNPDGTISSVVNGLWVDQQHPSTVLAATEFGGTFRSTDGGTSWTNVDSSESTQFSLAGSTLYVATRRGVLASNDDGATWQVSLASSAGATTVMTAGGTTYAGDASGDVYVLKGSSWSPAGHPGTGAIHDLAIDPFNAHVVYANVDDAKAWNQHLYGSTDGGAKWKRIHCRCSIGAQAVAFSITVPDRLYFADDGGGSIYNIVADGNPHPVIHFGARTNGADVRYIYSVPGSGSADGCYFTSDQGLLYSTNCSGGTTTVLSNNISNFLAYDATLSEDAANFVVALQDWGAVSGQVNPLQLHGVPGSSEGGETFLNPFSPQSCYFAHPDGGLSISSNACATFAAGRVSGIESLTFVPGTTNTLYAITNADTRQAQVSISTNGGTSFTSAGWTFKNPYQVVVSPVDPKTILVATGLPTQKPRLYLSRDGGTTWRRARGLPDTVTPNLRVGLYFPTHRFYATFEPDASGKVLLADHDTSTDNILMYRSVSNGQSFKLVSTLVQPVPPRPWPNLVFPDPDERPAPETPYYATRFYGNRLAFNPQAPSSAIPAVVATTRFGAFVSYDVGSQWTRIDGPAIAHHFIGVDWVNGYVYLASFGEGVIQSSTPLQ